MDRSRLTAAPLRRFFLGAMLALAALALSGCASFYVDSGTHDVDGTEYKRPAEPKPAQLVFEFQTKGAPNARATEYLRTAVTQQVAATGLFSALSDKPAADLPILTVVINNVPVTDDAFAKGFATGLTLGLAGNVVTDGYVCTVSYLAPGATTAVSANARHAIHTSMGNAQAPQNAVKVESAQVAVTTMARQIVGTALRDLSGKAEFVEVEAKK